MSIQYTDGTFSETLLFDRLMERFQQEIEDGDKPIKRLIFGTFQEVEEEKKKQEIEERVKQLEQKVKELSPAKTFLEIPTLKEIRKLTADGAAKED